jgi:ribonuclease R
MSKKHRKGPSKKHNQASGKEKTTLRDGIMHYFEQNPELILDYKIISKILMADDQQTKRQIYQILENLAATGILKEVNRGKFRYNGGANTVEGLLEFTPRGAAYLLVENQDEDIYINPKNTQYAIHGDRVKVKIINSSGRRVEGKVVEIVAREREFVVGQLSVSERFAFLRPDNMRLHVDIYIPKDKIGKARNGEKVMVKVLDWPHGAESPNGEVVEILGMPGTNDAEMVSILVENGINPKFPQEVIAQAEFVSTEITEDMIVGRKDFRDILTFTIDPLDARDFDDALSYRFLENGNKEIGVHIADVSHYVQTGSPMDIEAQKRSNSVYLVDRVVPMLPEQLSNFACSLRPNEDKLAFSAVFEFDAKDKIVNQWFGRTVIHSNRRFTYEEAQEVIEGKSEELKSEILDLDRIAKKYRKERLKNGAMNIESEEVRFKLDEFGQPEELIVKVSKDAHKLIEEFMLLANKHVSMFLSKTESKQEKPVSVYRVHDTPDQSKIELFKLFIDKFGYELPSYREDQLALSINKLLSDIRYKNEYGIIQSMAIRTMARAAYDTENIGHYGLAFDYYTHFTSPIRRYADLVIHRLLQSKLLGERPPYSQAELTTICKQASRMERKAVDAERDSTKYFQVLYLKDSVGETFDGIVQGITDFGMFVEMTENRCEGMVTLDDIQSDRYSFDQKNYQIIGSKTGNTFTMGSAVRVKIKDIDLRKRTSDLVLVEK